MGFPQEVQVDDSEGDAEDEEIFGDDFLSEDHERDSGYTPSIAVRSDGARDHVDPMEIPAPYGPEEYEGPEGSDLELEVPQLMGDLLWEHECRGHWPYDKGCDSCVQARGRTPARRRKQVEGDGRSADLAGDLMYVAGRHWKILVLLMIQTGVAGMVVFGGDREKDIKSVVSVLNEIGVGGLNLEVATDNEQYLVNLMERSLQASACRGFHWRNISECRPQAKGVERMSCIMKEGLFTNWLCLESKVGARLALESPLFGLLVGHVYRTHNAHCRKLKGGTPLEMMRGKRGGQPPRSYPFGILGYAKPVHARDWTGH